MLFRSLPWSRQHNESPKAYAAFTIYRDLGQYRSYDKAIVIANKKPSARRYWARWASKYKWVERAQLYDTHMDEINLQKKEEEVIKMAERHAKIALAFQSKVVKRLESIQPEDLNARETVRWFALATKIERISRGAPSDISKGEISGKGNIIISLTSADMGSDEEETNK